MVGVTARNSIMDATRIVPHMETERFNCCERNVTARRYVAIGKTPAPFSLPLPNPGYCYISIEFCSCKVCFVILSVWDFFFNHNMLYSMVYWFIYLRNINVSISKRITDYFFFKTNPYCYLQREHQLPIKWITAKCTSYYFFKISEYFSYESKIYHNVANQSLFKSWNLKALIFAQIQLSR